MASLEDITKMKESTKVHQDSLIVNCRKCVQRVEMLTQCEQPPPSHANLDAYVGVSDVNVFLFKKIFSNFVRHY